MRALPGFPLCSAALPRKLELMCQTSRRDAFKGTETWAPACVSARWLC